ncbi:heavy-metal-associated domain-containing protein [Mariniflexile sp.]|uniref:heavy-metal-associated domain-containing protein n=1 Tax=Mariniflexile sp. TaxID=1979402 RepID=UPI00404729EB
MRIKVKIMLFLMAFAAVTLSNAQEKTSEFEVLGNCNACKKRIEKAVNAIDGVASANWNKDTKIIQLTYDSGKTSLEDISKAINGVGHDTKFGKASDSTYDALPGCCQYDRAGTENMEASTANTAASFNFNVSGNCGMCKKRIEKAAKTVPGVTNATWDKETKIINVEVSNASSTTKQMVSKAIAEVGHDTELDKAETAVYDGLPGCCKYDREVTKNLEASTAKTVASFNFKVYGKCGMCKKRIEKAAKAVPGVTNAIWDKESKVVAIEVSDASTTKDNVSKAIAAVGHDTEFNKAETADYDSLPGCCKYDRIQ